MKAMLCPPRSMAVLRISNLRYPAGHSRSIKLPSPCPVAAARISMPTWVRQSGYIRVFRAWAIEYGKKLGKNL
ncbi:MAG: hypothetical protein QM690_02555 [Sphingobium sp.]